MSAGQPNTAFFDLIHPAAGWRCLFALPSKQHYWFDNDADLVRAAAELDRQELAVFHSCAVFKDKQRKQDSVLALKSFWLDIDAGIGKPYASAGEAYQALKSWLVDAVMPDPIIVASGGGLHVYWPLAEALPPSRWKPLAEQLRAMALEKGLHIDPGSTIDSARILRPPGTHNRKLLDESGKKLADVGGIPRKVKAGPLVGPYSLTDLVALNSAVIPPAELGSAPEFMKGVKTDATIWEIGAFQDQISDPNVVAERCGQVRRLRDAHGNIPEPEWYAVLGVLAHCGLPGRQAAHAWSAGDSRYSAADTDRKIDQYVANASGPTTCTRFGQLVNGPCLLCPSAGKITSPIQLGRDISAAVTAPAPSKMQLPRLPQGFRWNGSRLVMEREPTEDDPRDFVILSEYPVLVDELQEFERTKTISMVLRSWEPMANDWRDFIINNADIVGQTGYSKVSAHGVVVYAKRWPDFVRYTQACMIEHRASRPYGTRYEQFGWKTLNGAPAFVVGEEIIHAGQVQRVRGSDEVQRRGKLMANEGTAVEWSKAANQLIGVPGMGGHAFMLLCSFAAPLYKFTGEPGAPLVHGNSRGSGNGKTTIEQAGASVWGLPDATSIIERDTMVAKFITLGTLCHLPVFFDEMRFATPEDTKHYVLQATLGRDKQRGKAEGGLRADGLDWATIHISASNLSLTDTVRADGVETAQAARIFEFTLALPEGTKTTDGDALMRALRANRGTAGRSFIKAALENHAWVEKAVLERMKFYEERMAAGPDARFIIRLFACVDVAGALIQRCGLLAIDLDKIMAWAVAVQKNNTTRMASEAASDAAATLSQLVNDFIPHTLVVEHPATIGKSISEPVNQEFRGPLWGRLERQGRRLLFEISAVRKWMQERNHSFTEVQKELVELKVLVEPRVRKTLGAGTKLSFGQVWCWAIDGNHPLLAALGEVESNVVPLRSVG